MTKPKVTLLERLKDIKTIVTVIITLVGFLVSGTIWTYGKVDEFIHWKQSVDNILMKEDLINHVDAKVLKLVEDYESDRDSVREAVMGNKDLIDSARLFIREIKPYLRQFQEIDDIGLKRHRLTGKMKYIAPDGHLYRAFIDPENHQYYYIDESQNPKWCE